MSVATYIQKPNISRVILAEITVGMLLGGWIVDGVKAWVSDQENTGVTSVSFNGTALTLATNYDDLDAHDGYYLLEDGYIYVTPPIGQTIISGTYIATVSMKFASKEKILSNVYWEPRLIGVPNVSMRIEERFGGVGQIGGGTLKLINSDGYFDTLADLLWHSGYVTLKLGVDLPDSEMAYADYVQVGKWIVEDISRSDKEFSLRLKEIKTKLAKKVLVTVYDKATYPGIRDGDIGKPIPLAYGIIIGAKAACVDVALKKFKVASHAVRHFTSVKIKVDDVWTPSTFVTVDTANAEFTLGADWTGAEEISVDFEGKNNADGTLMDNAAYIIKDIMAAGGETDIDAASFAAAADALKTGIDNWGDVRTLYRAGLHITNSKDVVDVIGPLIEMASAFLFCDNNGQYHLEVFQPSAGESLQLFRDVDILDFEGPITDAQYLATSIDLDYAKREAEQKVSTLVTTSEKALRSAGLTVHKIEEKEIPFSDQSDAESWSNLFLLMRGKPITTYKVDMPWNASLLRPGDQISLELTRRPFSGTLEVLQVQQDLIAGKVSLTCGDLRGWRATPGFIVDAAATLPTRFSTLAGYGSGALTWNPAWDDQIKAWAKRNVGYVCNAQGCADSTDAGSAMVSTFTV